MLCYGDTYYKMCKVEEQISCYDAKIDLAQTWLVVHGQGSPKGPVLAQTQIKSDTSQGSVIFNVCKAVTFPTSCGRDLAYIFDGVYVCPQKWLTPSRQRQECYKAEESYCPHWNCVTWDTYTNE